MRGLAWLRGVLTCTQVQHLSRIVSQCQPSQLHPAYMRMCTHVATCPSVAAHTPTLSHPPAPTGALHTGSDPSLVAMT